MRTMTLEIFLVLLVLNVLWWARVLEGWMQ